MTISPENENDSREIVSELSSGHQSQNETPALPNMVITHDRESSRAESRHDAHPNVGEAEASNSGPSLDVENSSTLLSKGSRRSIVSVAFATCNESGQVQDEHEG